MQYFSLVHHVLYVGLSEKAELCAGYSVSGWGGKGAKSYDSEIAWSSIIHSILNVQRNNPIVWTIHSYTPNISAPSSFIS